MMGVELPTKSSKCLHKNLPLKIYVAYGLGHILNDVCAAMWFSYLLVFFHLILEFENAQAGILLLVGQVADAVATPFIGYHSDRDHKWWIYRLGKRKVWYLIGSVCVIITFPFIFSPCLGCRGSSKVFQMTYYSVFIVIFQFGWAAVQISHMSLIPEITTKEYQKTKLAAIRNGATVVASVLVYLVTWGILHMSGGSEKKIGPEQTEKFQHIVWSVMSFGLVCSIIFYIIIKEPETISKDDPSKLDNSCGGVKKLLLNINLYLVGTVYMSSRLFINLTQVFISLYLSESLDMVASSLALIPLVMYISSFVTSIPIGPITKMIGRKAGYILGACIGIVGCLCIHWGQGIDYITYYIYIVSVFFGAASTIILVSSLDITTDMIGTRTNQGAFIYGLMSFADKLSNGIAVEIIQNIQGGKSYYRDVLTYVCGSALVLGCLAVMVVKNTHQKPKCDQLENSVSTINTIDYA